MDFKCFMGFKQAKQSQTKVPELSNPMEFAKSFQDAGQRAKYWENVDPLPDIAPALLNSADISDYVRMTGMIYPFHSEDLSGATYTVRLGGICTYFDEFENGKIKQRAFCVGKDSSDLPHAEDNRKKYKIKNKLILKPNSITFLTLEPVLQVPQYMVLRFNLKIPHVYKGLLLGTGPIIDPGFKGRLSIPLHNLTSNEYVFSYGDEIISIEVTKMSPIHQYKVTPQMRLGKYIVREIPNHRQVDQYLQRALEKTNSNSVVSSITSTTNDAKKQAKQAMRAVRTLYKVGFISLIGLVIAIVTAVINLLLPSYQLMQSVVDNQTSYELRIDNLEKQISQLEKELATLDPSIVNTGEADPDAD